VTFLKPLKTVSKEHISMKFVANALELILVLSPQCGASHIYDNAPGALFRLRKEAYNPELFNKIFMIVFKFAFEFPILEGAYCTATYPKSRP